MDKLSDLPPKGDTVKTMEEEAIMNQFFDSASSPDGQRGVTKQHEDQETANLPNSSQTKLNWKIVGITALLFVVLANPWIDDLICKLPYCNENPLFLKDIYKKIEIKIEIYFPRSYIKSAKKINSNKISYCYIKYQLIIEIVSLLQDLQLCYYLCN